MDLQSGEIYSFIQEMFPEDISDYSAGFRGQSRTSHGKKSMDFFNHKGWTF